MTQPHARRAVTLLAAGLLTIRLIPALTQAASGAVRSNAPMVDLQDIVTPGDPVAGLEDFARQGMAQPQPSQRQAADGLGEVALRWNSFGTPASILPTDGPAPGPGVLPPL